MKLRAVLASVSLCSLAVLRADPPAVPIEQAIKIAQNRLADAHYIGGLVLEGKSETGLHINMDGTLLRFTAGGFAAASKYAPGVWRAGARKIR